jgi:hypothetical protein
MPGGLERIDEVFLKGCALRALLGAEWGRVRDSKPWACFGMASVIEAQSCTKRQIVEGDDDDVGGETS